MKDDAFRAFLTPSLTRGGVATYLANLRRVERTLRIDLDAADITPATLAGFRAKLIDTGLYAEKVSNCMSALSKYAAFQQGVGPAPNHWGKALRVVKPPTPESASAAQSRPIALALRSVPELMRLYADVLRELRTRGVLRTANGPIGDYAEMLFAEAFGWTLAGNSTLGYDAACDGLRYQIKARRVSSRNPSRQLGALRRLPDRQFDVLAAVLFDEDVRVLRAALIPHETVLTIARKVEHTNSWRVMLSDGVWSLPGVVDATFAIRQIADGQSISVVDVSG